MAPRAMIMEYGRYFCAKSIEALMFNVFNLACGSQFGIIPVTKENTELKSI